MAFPKRLGLTTPWTENDGAALRQYLGTVEGQRFLSKLFAMRPRATEKSDLARRAIQSGVSEGYEQLYHDIAYLSTPQSFDKVPQNDRL